MKKSLIVFSALVLAFASCKKTSSPAAFSPTDMTGKGHVKGNVTKNVIAPNGTGGWTSNTRVPAPNVNVSVRIDKSSLYPNSNSQGSDVYSATTDANGNYDIEVTANGNGVVANIVVDGFSSTLDTVVNGVVKTGLPALYAGGTGAVNVWTGQNSWFNYNFVASNVGSNPNNITIGTAMVSGSVGVSFVKATINGTNTPVYSTTVVPVSNTNVYMNFNMDPTLMATKQYTATTDAMGNYTITVSTVKNGTPGFNQNALIWVADRAGTRDTVKIVNGTTVNPYTTGPSGVFNSVNTFQLGVYNTEIRNAVNLTYSSFTPN
jgi:hypothetical protein